MSAEPPPPPPPVTTQSPFGRFQTVSVLAVAIVAVVVAFAAIAGGGGTTSQAPSASEYAECAQAFPQSNVCSVLQDTAADSARAVWRSCRGSLQAPEVCLADAVREGDANSTPEYIQCLIEAAASERCNALRGPGSRSARAAWRSCIEESTDPDTCLVRAERLVEP
jgi:hypothetical protein